MGQSTTTNFMDKLRSYEARAKCKRDLSNGVPTNNTNAPIIKRAKLLYKSNRTYELPYYTYYFILNCFKGRHVKIKTVEQLCYKKLKYKRLLITREHHDTRNEHYNVLITSAKDPRTVKGWGKHFTKPNIQTAYGIKDISNIIPYMFKEANLKTFIEKEDYIIHIK